MRRHAQNSEIFVAAIECSSKSTCPPPGKYLTVAFGPGDEKMRCFLTEEQAIALAKWLMPPPPPVPPVCSVTGRRRRAGRKPMLFTAASVEWDGERPAVGQAGSEGSGPARPSASGQEVNHVGPAGSEDKLLTSGFINGFRQRFESYSTAELDRELSSFEPDLARAVNRVIRSTVAGHLSRGEAGHNAAAEACHRETVLFLLALRGGYGDLLCGLI